MCLLFPSSVYTFSECHQDLEICQWSSKHDIVPSDIMNTWMQSIIEERGKQLIEEQHMYQMLSSGAGWQKQPLIKASPSSASVFSSSILHPITSDTFFLTPSSVAAYHQYRCPNILNNYTYSLPPFVFPAVQGYIQLLDIELDLPLDALRRETENGGEGMKLTPASTASVDPHTPHNSRNMHISPTLSLASTAVNSETGSPYTADSPSAATSPQFLDSPSYSPMSYTVIPTSLEPLESLQHLELNHRSRVRPLSQHQYLQPTLNQIRRSSMPSKSTSSPSSALVPASSPASKSLDLIPTSLLFQSTWSLGGEYYRHSTRSLVSEFLGVDVPASLCPFNACSRVLFAYAFMPNEQLPQPCLILQHH